MKKLTLILSLMIVLVGLNANAQMYVIGDGPMGGWSTNNPKEMTDNGDGTYSVVATLNSQTIYFNFLDGKTENSGDWNALLDYRFSPANDGDTPNTGEWIAATKNRTGNAYKFYGNGEYIFTFDKANSKFMIDGYVAPPVITVYSAVGDFNNWNEKDTIGDMTLENGVYTVTLENVTLSEGTFSYKVVGNHDWGFEWPQGMGNNFTEEVPSNGIYDITITFDPATGEATCTLTPVQELETYYIVAGSENMFGSNWNANDEANLMTLADSLYTWTKNDVEMTAGYEFQFKVVANGNWNTCWPESNEEGDNNWIYTCPEDGTYDIVITFDPETKWITCVATKQGGEEPPVEMVYTVVGPEHVFGTEWDTTDTNNDMVLDAETGLYTWTADSVALTESFGFKVVGNHTWANEWPQGMDNNWIVNITEAGNYSLVITFNAETGEINCVATKIGGGEEPPVEMVYTVVGPEHVFGTEWDTTDTNNDMVLDAETGLYTWTADSVALTESFGFKVVGNHTWANEWPQGMDNNWIVNITEAGNYSLVITFNAETGEINCVATKLGGGEEPPVEMVYTIVGDENVFGSNWDTNDENNELVKGEDGVYTWSKKDVTLYNSFQFKVVGNHDYAVYEWPVGPYNWVANLPEEDGEGIYDILITFNPEAADSVKITCTLTKVGEVDPIEHVYTVVGPEHVFGSEWNTNDENNNMTLDAETGLYTWSKENVALTESFGFKVVGDHSWANEWPQGYDNNWIVNIEEAGNYNLFITFNAETGEINCTATLVVEPVGMRGDVNNDGVVAIADVTTLINHVLMNDFTDGDNFNSANADCNKDGKWNISDVTALINYILSKQWPE